MRWIALLLLTGCGSSFPTGTFDVSIFYKIDTWPNGMQGDTSEAKWHISEKDDRYTLEILETDFVYKNGQLKNERLLFNKVSEGEDCFHSKVDLALKESSDDRFTGVGEIVVNLNCNGDQLLTAVEVDGERQ